MDLIIKATSEEKKGSSKEKSIIPVVSQADHAIEVPHIDFIFKDQAFRIKDCNLEVQTLHPIIWLSIQAKFDRQRQRCLQSTSSLEEMIN